MDARLRDEFDRIVEDVINTLPPPLHELLQAVPVCVEDAPNAAMRAELGVGADELLGLYSGTPLTEQESDLCGEPSEIILLFRNALIAACTSEREPLNLTALREQIRITLLHELGHHYGLDEDRLHELGYG